MLSLSNGCICAGIAFRPSFIIFSNHWVTILITTKQSSPQNFSHCHQGGHPVCNTAPNYNYVDKSVSPTPMIFSAFTSMPSRNVGLGCTYLWRCWLILPSTFRLIEGGPFIQYVHCALPSGCWFYLIISISIMLVRSSRRVMRFLKLIVEISGLEYDTDDGTEDWIL